MERDRKIQLLLDMQEHPEQHSEQALKAMLKDPEVCELTEATAELKQAMTWEESPMINDVDAEWQQFAALHFTKDKALRGWLKVAASIIGILMVSGIAFAAIHIVRQSAKPQEPVEATKVQPTTSDKSIAMTDTIVADTSSIPSVRYDEATLLQILTDMASYYQLRLDWQNEEAKSLRLFYIWNKRLTAEESVKTMDSFERIHLELTDTILTVK